MFVAIVMRSSLPATSKKKTKLVAIAEIVIALEF